MQSAMAKLTASSQQQKMKLKADRRERERIFHRPKVSHVWDLGLGNTLQGTVSNTGARTL